jgi:hypothetical protein
MEKLLSYSMSSSILKITQKLYLWHGSLSPDPAQVGVSKASEEG